MRKKTKKTKTTSQKKTVSLPYDLIQGAFGKRYVFFDTLRDSPGIYQDIYKKATDVINGFDISLASTSADGNNTRFKEALDFLKNSAEFERAKELRFFQNFESRYPEIKQLFQIDAKSILDDYPGFIININKALKGTEAFKKIIASEQKRIEDNKKSSNKYYDLIKNIDKAEKDKYLKDLYADKNKNNERFFLTANGKSMFESIFSEKNKGMNEISQLIIFKFGAKLFTWKKDNLELDGRQLDALLALINMKANEIFLSQIKMENPTITIQESTDSILNNPELEKFINDLLKLPDLDQALTSVANQYGLQLGNIDELTKNTTLINRLKSNLKSKYDTLVKEGKINSKTMPYKSWLASMGITDQKLNSMYNSLNVISSQAYYVSEDLGLADFLMNKINAILGGGANPTDDIEAGTLITNLTFNSNKLNALEQKLWDEQAKHYKRVKATSTLESFQHNTEELKLAREEQVRLIGEFIKQTDRGTLAAEELLKHINIHSTVKAYESAGSYAFEQYGGFGGAAFGSTLLDELGILSSVGNAAGLVFSKQDQEDFFLAMINAGQLMIGKELKPKIENYFSTFIGLLMFNDAEIAAMDVKNWIENNKQATSTVEDLHLYQLNGVIIPSSYLLEETYKALQPVANEVQKASKGIHVTLKTYNKGPINHNWDETAATAISVTKLERMHFLAGFADFIDNLNSRMNSIG